MAKDQMPNLIGDVYDYYNPQTSKINPNYNSDIVQDGSGNWFYKSSGLPANPANANPYNNPTLWNRVLSPDSANQISQFNLQQQQAPLVANQQANTARSVNERLTGQNDQQYGWSYDPNSSPIVQNKQKQAQLFAQQGGVQANANADYNTAIATQQEQANNANRAVVSGLLGNPGLDASVENQGLNYQGSKISGDQALLPYQQRNEGQTLANQYQLGLGESDRIPFLNSGQLADAQTGDILANQRLGLTPYATQQMGNEAISSLYQSQHPSIYSSLSNASIDSRNGTISPGRFLSPEMRGAEGMGMLPPTANAVHASPSGWTMPPKSNIINPLNQPPTLGIQATPDGKLIRGGIPVSEDNVSDPESFQNPNQAHKPLTTGQRLLQGITPTLAGGVNPHSRAADFATSQAINARNSETARIQQLKSILTNPPTHNNPRTGKVSDYSHDQLQAMADELDKLLGE